MKLPDGWRMSTIGDVAEINPRPSLGDPDDSFRVSFIPMAAVEAGTGYLDPSDAHPFGDLRRRSLRRFEEGDVVVAKITPSMENGKAATASGLVGGMAFGSTELHVLRPGPGVLREYLLWFVLQEQFRRDAARNMTGTAGQLRVPASYLAASPIPIPPLDEQERIIAVLDTARERINRANGALSRAGRDLGRLRSSVLAKGFHGGFVSTIDALRGFSQVAAIAEEREALWSVKGFGRFRVGSQPAGRPPLPERWERASLGQISYRITKGTTPTSLGFEYVESGVRFVKVESLINGRIDHQRCAAITPEADEALARSKLEAGDLLISIAGTIGRTAIVQEHDLPANTNQAIAIVRLVQPEMAPFMQWWLDSPYGMRALAAGGRGVGLQNLNLAQVGETCVPVPPEVERLRTTRAIEDLLGQAARLETSVTRYSVAAKSLHVSILAAAFAGLLDSQGCQS